MATLCMGGTIAYACMHLRCNTATEAGHCHARVAGVDEAVFGRVEAPNQRRLIGRGKVEERM